MSAESQVEHQKQNQMAIEYSCRFKGVPSDVENRVRMHCFFFDSLTGRIGEKSDPYLVQMGKSYFNRKTVLCFNRKTGKRFLKLLTLLFTKKTLFFLFLSHAGKRSTVRTDRSASKRSLRQSEDFTECLAMRGKNHHGLHRTD